MLRKIALDALLMAADIDGRAKKKMYCFVRGARIAAVTEPK